MHLFLDQTSTKTGNIYYIKKPLLLILKRYAKSRQLEIRTPYEKLCSDNSSAYFIRNFIVIGGRSTDGLWDFFFTGWWAGSALLSRSSPKFNGLFLPNASPLPTVSVSLYSILAKKILTCSFKTQILTSPINTQTFLFHPVNFKIFTRQA